ncbi:MAG: hypothetical protein ABJN65_01460 [Parasphingorhabdus sp.]
MTERYIPSWELEAEEELNPPQTDTVSRARTPKGGLMAELDEWSRKPEAFINGVADTITFGGIDELTGAIGSAFTDSGYEESRDQAREFRDTLETEHGTYYLTGQLTGAFLGASGTIAKLAGTGVKGVVGAGAIEGGLYGFGSADGDFKERAEGGMYGALFGAGTGYALSGILMPLGKNLYTKFRTGKEPSITPSIIQQLDVVEDTLASAGVPQRPRVAVGARPVRSNAITGTAEDVVDDGAMLSVKELLGDPGAARAALTKRIGKMSSQEAVRLSQRLQEAELAGTVIDDPHYRSLLGIDLGDTSVTSEQAMRAVELLEESIGEIIEKAGTGSRTMAGIRKETSDRLEEGVVMADLEEAFKNTRQGIIDTRVARHAMMLSAVQFQRAKDKLLPRILDGDANARGELAEVVTKSAHLLAYSKGIVGNAGRALRGLRDDSALAIDDVADDELELESIEQIRSRVNKSLAELGDNDLKAALDKLRTLSDVEKLEDILLNPQRAKEFTAWQRTMNTVSLALRSNALTPATALFNTLSFIVHDIFKNDWVRRMAARSLRRDGRMDEALKVEIQRNLSNKMYWQAQKQGAKAFINRIKWEYWSDVERIGAVSWSKRLAAKAEAKKDTILADGYQVPDLREYESNAGVGVLDSDAFNSRLNDLKEEGGAFAGLVYHTSRAAAVAGNTVEAAVGAGMKAFTGAVDDWGRSFVKVKEAYAESAAFAFEEAAERGLEGDELAEYVAKRSRELAEFPPSEVLEKAEERLLKNGELDSETQFLVELDETLNKKSDNILFMDAPTTGIGKASVTLAKGADSLVGLGQVEGILMPYIRTPIRLFEVGLIENTPLALASRQFREQLKAGGIEAALAKAQIEVGSMAIIVGALMGASGALTLTNGGWKNTGNLAEGPPNRVNLPGGNYVEIGRLDPLAITMAMGGVIGQSLKVGYEDTNQYDFDQGIASAMGIAFLATRDAMLEKSYLTGLQDILETAFAADGSASTARLEKIASNAMTRLVPFSGTSRQITETIRGDAPEAVSILDGMLRGIPGGSMYLPDRIDPLGNSIDSRVMGLAIGSNSADELTTMMRELEIDITSLRKADPRGFDYTSEELSQLRKIRATEATNKWGQTMREALIELISSNDFKALPEKEEKRRQVVETMSDFNTAARDILENRDENFRSTREGFRAFKEYLREGRSRDAARDTTLSDLDAAGLGNPDRL